MSNTMTRWMGRVSAGLVLLLALQPSAHADWELNMTRGVTGISGEVYSLHMLIFGVCVVIAVAVFGLMIFSIVKHRKSRGAEPATFTHSTRVEIVWTVIPIIILIAMAIPAADTLVRMEDTRNSDLTVKVTGYQWKWQYDYIDEGISFFSSLAAESNRARQLDSGVDPFTVDNYLLDVDNPLVVPAGAKVRILITSNDVIHSWWVPAFGGKKDAIPGFVNEFWFQAEEPGTYRGQCAELCGRDHGFMPVVVQVVSPDEFHTWVAEHAPAADSSAQQVAEAPSEPAPASGGIIAEAAAATPETPAPAGWSMATAMAEGETLYDGTCAACHQANGQGLAAAGFPALAGSPVATGPMGEHIRVAVHGRPGTAMAAFGPQFSDEELAAIVTYQRNAWGNNTGDLVAPEDIAAAR